MLVIRRRAGEAIVLPDGIEIHVLDISGSRVKLGVVAPAQVAVVRKEAVEARRQNLAAAASPLPNALTAWAQAYRDGSEQVRSED
ncbi:MAG TPA: carbon storage regulator [Paludibaculum sp.]|jgi:carbon storage regulator